MLAKDVMTRDVLTIAPETSLVDAARLLLSQHLSSVPVVDKKGQLVGMVSEIDLIHRSEIGTNRPHAWWQVFSLEQDAYADDFLRVHGVEVSHVMSRQVVTATETDTVGHIVDTFDRFDINRVPILRGDKMVGIVSRSDILRVFSGLQRPKAAGSRSDGDISKDLDALLAEASWIAVTPVSAAVEHEVKDGVVYLSGVVGTEREREALVVGAQTIAGVKKVEADLSVVPRDIAAL